LLIGRTLLRIGLGRIRRGIKTLSNLLAGSRDRFVQRLNQRELFGQHEAMMRVKHPHQGFCYLSPFGLQSPSCQISQLGRISVSRKQRLSHGSCGLAHAIRSDIPQFEIGLFHRFLPAD
jgi:hypothetical protein